MKKEKERKSHPFRTVLLTLEYDGTRYAGWQSQNKGEQTIQDTLEKAVTTILGHRVPAVASGRTDAGVHALAQPVSIKGHFPMNDDALIRALNSLLPDDIAVKKAVTVDDSFHAIKDAKQKTYRYVIHNGRERNPLGLRYSWHVIQKLNSADMRRGAEPLVGQHDFASFMAANSQVKSTVRHIIAIDIERKGDTITIEITANGFLRQMVRNIVGTLVEIGRGRMEPEEMKKILMAKDRRKAGPTAPAQGLTLVEVVYV